MPKVIPNVQPVIQREVDEIAAYLALDAPPSVAWLKILATMAGSGEKGFEIGAGVILPRYATGPAVYVRTSLEGLAGTGVKARLHEAMTLAIQLAEEADKEDRRQEELVRQLSEAYKPL